MQSGSGTAATGSKASRKQAAEDDEYANAEKNAPATAAAVAGKAVASKAGADPQAGSGSGSFGRGSWVKDKLTQKQLSSLIKQMFRGLAVRVQLLKPGIVTPSTTNILVL